MAELLESSNPAIAWVLEVAFPASTHEQRDAIIQRMPEATRVAILALLNESSTPGIKLVEAITGRVAISASVRDEVQRLILNSESV